MSILQVKRTWKGEEATATRETWHYLVEASDKGTTCQQARMANDGVTAIPLDGTVLAGTSLRSRATARRIDANPKFFNVEVVWESPSGAGGGESKPETPGAKWNIQISARTIPWQEPTNQDRDGNPIRNPNGEMYTPGLLKDFADEEFVISFATDNSFDTEALSTYLWTINSGAVTLNIKGQSRSFAANTLCLVDYSWGYSYDSIADPQEPDFSVQLVLRYRAGTWKRRVVITGYTYKDLVGGKIVPKLDDAGNRVTTPIFLNTNGEELGSGMPVQFTEHWINDAKNFSTLLGGL